MSTRGDPGGDLVDMQLHGFGVAGRQHKGGADSEFSPSPLEILRHATECYLLYGELSQVPDVAIRSASVDAVSSEP